MGMSFFLLSDSFLRMNSVRIQNFSQNSDLNLEKEKKRKDAPIFFLVTLILCRELRPEAHTMKHFCLIQLMSGLTLRFLHDEGGSLLKGGISPWKPML